MFLGSTLKNLLISGLMHHTLDLELVRQAQLAISAVMLAGIAHTRLSRRSPAAPGPSRGGSVNAKVSVISSPVIKRGCERFVLCF